MEYRIVPQSIVLLFTTLIMTGVSVAVWRRRTATTSGLMLWMNAGIIVWTLGSMLENMAVTQAEKILWSKVEYIGFTSVPAFLVIFSVSYVRRLRCLKPVAFGLLWIIPALTLVLAWTNDWHGLIWPGFRPGPAEFNILIYEHGPAYWLYVAYVYTLFIFTAFFLYREASTLAAPYRGQVSVLLLAACFPVIGGLVYIFDLSPIPGLNWVSLACAASSLALAGNMYFFRLLDLAPVARVLLLENLEIGVIALDLNGRIADLNKAAARLFVRLPNGLIGKPASALLPLDWDIEKLELSGPARGFNLPGWPPRHIEVKAVGIFSNLGHLEGRLLVLTDVTAQKSSELELQKTNQRLKDKLAANLILQEQLREQAIRDPLTGLYNRRYLNETLERELIRADRQHYPVSLLMLDLDHFKRVNDTYGHETGDRVLKALGNLLLSLTRKDDVACRIGGEEFVVVLPGASLIDACERGEQIRRSFAGLGSTQGTDLHSLTISVGAAVYPDNAATSQALIDCADQAMYIAKQNGRNRLEVFQPSVNGTGQPAA